MNEQYHLAVDVGTSRVAAATARLAADGSILTTPFALGRRSDSVSTVVFVAEDGQLLVGDAAERRGVAQPDRLIREFKRSVGDEIPLVVAGRSIPAEQLYAHTVAMVVEQVTEREGARPDSITLTHPATWGPHRLGLILAALEVEGVGEVELISEPEAAARSYEFYRPLAVGQTLAVYDLGGGTFDAVLLRKDASGAFALVGNPVGIDNLGGADFDDAVLRHVLQSAKVIGLDPADPDTRLALAQLRRECVDAKEALSFDSDATIPVLLPTRSARIRLTRSEFESMIDPSLEKTINALDDALEEGGVDGDDIECILLIGGSSRIPLVTQKLSERFDRPTAIDADPKSSIALGAALTGLVRHNDRDLGVGSELALIEPTADAALELFQPAGAVATLAAPVNAAAPKTGKVHTLALAGGAVLIAGAIVFGSTFTAGSGLFFTPTASTVKPLVDWSKVNPTVAAPPAPDAAAPGPVAESAPQDQTDSRSPATQRRAPQKTTETRETTNVKT
ncbi:MAG: Hsp70 family protein, partial [Microbacterium sp.]